ncbi:MAG: phage terminase small subunit P27 family, partial [Lactococcus plantarum]|nr:phage terminase small subunit P27 family [Lactococcus plantarum]
DAIKNLTKIGSELGLSPKSRSELIELNMQDTNEKSTKDKMKAFFDGGDDDDY